MPPAPVHRSHQDRKRNHRGRAEHRSICQPR
nr:MAG TPA: hypothetical protein [Caudoviricetes sp.]